MTAYLPTRTIYRNADWVEEIRLQSLEGEYDLTGVGVEAALALVPGDGTHRVVASIDVGTIEAVQVAGPEAVFVIRVPNAVIAALPEGEYAMDVRLEVDGVLYILARGIRLLRDGVTP